MMKFSAISSCISFIAVLYLATSLASPVPENGTLERALAEELGGADVMEQEQEAYSHPYPQRTVMNFARFLALMPHRAARLGKPQPMRPASPSVWGPAETPNKRARLSMGLALDALSNMVAAERGRNEANSVQRQLLRVGRK